MVTQLVLLGVLAGADNFVVSSILGGFALSRPQRCWLAAAFGLCEAATPWLGGALLAAFSASGSARLAELAPWSLLASGLLSLLGAAWAAGALAKAGPGQAAAPASQAHSGGERVWRNGRLGWLTLLLPPALSLDNLAAGAGAQQPGAWPLASALTIGSVSAALAALGLMLGDRVVLRWRVPRTLWMGSGLLVCGLIALASER